MKDKSLQHIADSYFNFETKVHNVLQALVSIISDASVGTRRDLLRGAEAEERAQRRARSAEAAQGKFPGVEAALDRYLAQRPPHVFVGQADDALARVLQGFAHAVGQSLQGMACSGFVQGHAAAEELIGARFVIDNPNASSSCGCGVSFSM